MAEYCHNSWSQCLPFARIHVHVHSTPLVGCIVDDGLVNAMSKMQKTLLQFTKFV